MSKVKCCEEIEFWTIEVIVEDDTANGSSFWLILDLEHTNNSIRVRLKMTDGELFEVMKERARKLAYSQIIP